MFEADWGTVLDLSVPRKTRGASIWTWMSAGLMAGGMASALVAGTVAFVPGVTATAARDPLGSGGSMGSRDGEEEERVGAVDEGRCKSGGRFASAISAVLGGVDARITGGGGAAHPQSNGTSLLTRSILPS